MTSQPIIEYFANHSSNLTGLHIFCSNKCNVWYLLLATKVIELNCPCPKCQTITSVLHHTCEKYFNLVSFCPKCRIHFSLYHHTILTRSHIELPTFLALANCWVNNYSLDAFAIIVPDRTAPTLNKEIADHISTGSIIHSDSWASYQQIEAISNKNFVHYSVNYSKNFVDPETGSHTQGIERMWRDLKETAYFILFLLK